MRVLILSHGHPTFSKGGGEYAAYYLYQGINETKEHEAWFVGRAAPNLLTAGNEVDSINEREFLMAGDAIIYSLTTSVRLDDESDFANMLRSVNPDVVHFHHYVHLGLELIGAVKRICPKAKIVLTLHEFIAICNHNGQMIKTNFRLCYKSSPRECSQCFPDKSPADFFLRERYIKLFFGMVDQFISPSHFLKERYVDWGLAANKIEVIENGQVEAERIPPRPLAEGEVRGRFAYFGQINPYKGLDIVLEAFDKLPKKVKKQVSLDIFGSGLENQTPQFQEKVWTLINRNTKFIRLHGAYEQEELGRLMANIDWVIMGSVWWENSPLVIQEAFKYGRPMIVSNIGGMAEKVKDGVDGLHFRAGSGLDLAAKIENIVNQPSIWPEMHENLPKVASISAATADHIRLYEINNNY